METINKSTIRYQDGSAIISAAVIEKAHGLLDFCEEIRYVSKVVPSSYKYRKNCQWLTATKEGVVIADGYAKSAPHGEGSKWSVVAKDQKAIDYLKSLGWKLISKQDRRLTF